MPASGDGAGARQGDGLGAAGVLERRAELDVLGQGHRDRDGRIAEVGEPLAEGPAAIHARNVSIAGELHGVVGGADQPARKSPGTIDDDVGAAQDDIDALSEGTVVGGDREGVVAASQEILLDAAIARRRARIRQLDALRALGAGKGLLEAVVLLDRHHLVEVGVAEVGQAEARRRAAVDGPDAAGGREPQPIVGVAADEIALVDDTDVEDHRIGAARADIDVLREAAQAEGVVGSREHPAVDKGVEPDAAGHGVGEGDRGVHGGRASRQVDAEHREELILGKGDRRVRIGRGIDEQRGRAETEHGDRAGAEVGRCGVDLDDVEASPQVQGPGTGEVLWVDDRIAVEAEYRVELRSGIEADRVGERGR